MRRFGARVLWLCLLLGGPVPARAGTVWTVDPGGGGDFTTLQACIDSPAVRDGDTCRAAPGTYRENVRFRGKGITLSGAGGAAQTLIDGGGAGSTVTFNSAEGPDTVLEGFTIRNGSGTWVGYLCLGGGIFLSGAAPEIRDCVIAGNTVSVDEEFAMGGGIASYFSSPALTRCTIRDNETRAEGAKGSGGGGIFILGGAPQISGCRIEDNACLHGDETLGGGISCLSASPTIVNSVIARNRASGEGIYVGGGGLFLSEAAPLLLHCTVAGNAVSGGGTYPIGGGLLLVEHASPRVLNSILWADTSPFGPEIYALEGAAIEVLFSDVQMEDESQTWPGEGNINLDPLFAPLGADHLSSRSPCIDRGDDALCGSLETDLDGRPRSSDGDCDNQRAVDMGADEFQRLCPWPSAAVLAPQAPAGRHGRADGPVNALLLPALIPALLLVRAGLRGRRRTR